MQDKNIGIVLVQQLLIQNTFFKNGTVRKLKTKKTFTHTNNYDIHVDVSHNALNI